VAAINYAYLNSHGDYVFSFNDESELDVNALRALKEAADVTPECLLALNHIPPFNFTYYGKLFAPFPFATRTLFDEMGGVADPVYKAYYHDSDLSHRVRASGRDVRVVPNATIYHHQNTRDPIYTENMAAYLVPDRAVYIPRWAHLGEFRDP
jgi:GT2 family glycosyltransferase